MRGSLARWAASEEEDHAQKKSPSVGPGGPHLLSLGPEKGALGAVVGRPEYVISGAVPLPGERRGLRLVQRRGRKAVRRDGGRAGEHRGGLGALRTAGFARLASPPKASRWGHCGFASGRVRGLPALAQCLCSVLQVYPEPRCESECLSNIREFLRGCGASLRLEVSGPRDEISGAGGW